jgi:hypothetical protein
MLFKYDLYNNLVSWYKLDDTTTNIKNEIGSTNGTLSGTLTSVTGQVGNALSLNGSSYIDTNQTYQSTFRDSFTISFWAKPTDGIPDSSQFLLGLDDYISMPYSSNLYYYLANGMIMTNYQTNNQAITVNATSSQVFADGQASVYKLITVVYDKINSSTVNAYIYINGTLANSFLNQTCDMSKFVSNKNLYIGCRILNGNPMSPFTGAIDNFMLFNKALSQKEITFLYNEKTFSITSVNHYELLDGTTVLEHYPNLTTYFNTTLNLTGYTGTKSFYLKPISKYDVAGDPSCQLDLPVASGAIVETPQETIYDLVVNQTSDSKLKISFKYPVVKMFNPTAFKIYTTSTLTSSSSSSSGVPTNWVYLGESITNNSNSFTYTTTAIFTGTVYVKVQPINGTAELTDTNWESITIDDVAPSITGFDNTITITLSS